MKELVVATISDVHLGHKRNPTVDIIANLNENIINNPDARLLDILFIAGDFYDGLLSLDDDEAAETDIFISCLLRFCKQNDIVLRVLKGTPSHDWDQSERFVTIQEVGQFETDLKYVKELSIEYIERFDIHVLYVPDEWDSSTEKTFEQVQQLLKAKGLTKVDFAIMHGQFEYQLPDVVKAPKHSSESYLEIVSKLIFIGHVHTHSRHERIIAQGSFDRLSHGEEGPKGYVRAHICSNGDMDVVFVENKNAKTFVTIDCTNMSVEELLVKVDNECRELRDGSHVRIMAEESNPVFSNMEVLVRLYPLLIWSKKPVEEKKEEEIVVEIDTPYTPITLTKDNLGELLIEKIIHAGCSGEVVLASKDILAEAL